MFSKCSDVAREKQYLKNDSGGFKLILKGTGKKNIFGILFMFLVLECFKSTCHFRLNIVYSKSCVYYCNVCLSATADVVYCH